MILEKRTGRPIRRRMRRQERRHAFSWRRLLWSLLYPRRRQRTAPTLAGILLITLAMGIGVAAYNSANNILFITLSLLLSCLILSGLLSWMNLHRVEWSLEAAPPFRVGQLATAAVVVRNHKRLLPTYGLWFGIRTTSASAETRLVLRERAEPADGEVRLEWSFRPSQRGREVIHLVHVGSLFPFGFLRKTLACDVRQEVIVWPAPVDYRRDHVSAPARALSGEPVARLGHSSDLLGLRRYTAGDSHRLIHWKASARLRQLMVRQFATESQERFSLWLHAPAEIWTRPDQFELLCSFATTLAEDLFTADRLGSVAVDEDPPRPVRRLRDLETFFDRVALLAPVSPGPKLATEARSHTPPHRNLLTFAPDGPRGVAALIDGQSAAAA